MSTSALLGLLAAGCVSAGGFARYSLRSRAGNVHLELKLAVPKVVHNVRNLVINATLANVGTRGTDVNPHNTTLTSFKRTPS